MAGLARVLWVGVKKFPKQPYDCVARGGESRRVADSKELGMLHD